MNEPNLNEQPTAPSPVACSTLLGAALDLRSEMYECNFKAKLNFGEVGTDTFMAWLKWRMETSPTFEGTPLTDFDLLSVMSMFEEWVNASNAGTQRPGTQGAAACNQDAQETKNA